MKTITKISTVCAFLMTLCFSMSASASLIANSYEASAAVSDPLYYGHSNQHALYLPSYASDMVFETGARFEMYADGSGMLTATAYSLSNHDLAFEVTLTFTGQTESAGAGGPKRELQNHAYTENGGIVDTASWFYYESWTGQLVGKGAAAGTTLNLVSRGAPFQWGIGANGKNVEFGGSGWFTAYLEGGTSSSTGDFNLNAQPVPLPAGLPLLVAGLASLGLISRRGQ